MGIVCRRKVDRGYPAVSFVTLPAPSEKSLKFFLQCLNRMEFRNRLRDFAYGEELNILLFFLREEKKKNVDEKN